MNQNLRGNSRSPSVLQVFVEACDMTTVFLVPSARLFPAGCLMSFFNPEMLLNTSHKRSLS